MIGCTVHRSGVRRVRQVHGQRVARAQHVRRPHARLRPRFQPENRADARRRCVRAQVRAVHRALARWRHPQRQGADHSCKRHLPHHRQTDEHHGWVLLADVSSVCGSAMQCSVCCCWHLDAAEEGEKTSIDVHLSQHVLVSSLFELGCLVHSLGTSASPLVSEPSAGEVSMKQCVVQV